MKPHVAAEPHAAEFLRLPIVIGVTGHRDLRDQDTALLRQAVGDCLAGLRKLCPHTPMVVLSPLAEGADRLVAEVALAQGMSLVVPLPMARSAYEEDFADASDAEHGTRSVAQFNDLLGRATRHFEVPHMRSSADSAITTHGPARDLLYLDAGAYVVRHCHVLIALWDGETADPEPVGGTSQIVRYRLNGLPEPYAQMPNPLDAAAAGPVIHVVTPRTSNRQMPADAFAVRVLLPEASLAADTQHPASLANTAVAAALSRLDGLNRDLAQLGDEVRDGFATSRGQLIQPDAAGGLDDAQRDTLDRYAATDVLAQHFQRRRRAVLVSLFLIAMLAVLFFEIYAHLLPHKGVLAMYPLTLLIGFGVLRFAQLRDFHNKHLDYRALAEGLRVQLFWQIAGLSADVSDHYLRKQRSELEWVREALRTHLRLPDWGLATGQAGAASKRNPAEALRALVLPLWVSCQRRFYENAGVRDHHGMERRESWERALVAVGVGIGLLIWLSPWIAPANHADTTHHVLVVFMGLLPAVAAALSGYAERMAFGPQAKRYRWMAALYARAERRLQVALNQGHLDDAQRLVLELGNEALLENGDWVMMHRDRPPEASKVG
jgi:hypothetical protein